MNAFTIAEAVAASSFLSVVLFLATDATIRNKVRTHWKVLLVLVCITALWRWPFNSAFFHGLEYEDSYVYTVVARAPASPKIGEKVGSVFLTSTCVVGSLADCQYFETYSGHYIGWPAIIRIAINVIGYSPELPLYLNILGSCTSVVFIFLICCLAIDDRMVAIAAAFVFATTPVFAVNGIAAYAEPISNTCLAAALMLAIRFLCKEHGSSFAFALNWFALTTTLILAVLVKRENALLAITLLLCTAALWLKSRSKKRFPRELIWTAGSCVAVLVFCVASLRLGKTVSAESREFGGFPFGYRNLQVLLVPFLKACFSFKWYSVSAELVVIGMIKAIRAARIATIPMCLLLGYLLLYILHVHGYYQVHGTPVLPYETLRFTMNVMTLYSLLAGLGLAAVIRIVSNTQAGRAGFAALLLLLYIISSYLATARLREKSHAEEYAVRINPALAALDVARQDDKGVIYIVTLEPLVVQIFGSRQTKAIGLYALNNDLMTGLREQHPSLSLLFIDQSEYGNPLAETRYASSLKCLDGFSQQPVLVGEQYVLKRILTKLNDR
jgi:hypothetical protein